MTQFTSIHKQWAIHLLIGGVLLVVTMTLFPYDFFFQEMVSQLTFNELLELLKKSSSISDIVLNLLLFIPFGFGLASLLENFNIPAKRSLFLIAIASLVLSLTVEILQFFLPARTSTSIDLLTNTLSGIGGALLFQSIGHLLLTQCERFYGWIKRFLSISNLTIFFISYFILSCLISLPLQNTNQLWSLANWNSEFPLILGNELTGDRPWRGKIDQFCLINQVASNQEIKQVFTSEYPCNDFSINERILHSETQPDLSLMSVNQVTQRLRQTSELILAIRLATADTHQTGPARILSISKNLFQRNLTLGQWRSHLSIRLRTPVTGENGTQPEFIIPNVFSGLKTHTILLLYNPFHILVFIDDIHHYYQLKMTPEMALFWQLSPVLQGSIHLNFWNPLFYKFLYYCLIFCPLGWCLGLILIQMRGKLSFYLLFISSGVILPSLLLEMLLSYEGNRMISWENILLSLSITVMALYFSRRNEKRDYIGFG